MSYCYFNGDITRYEACTLHVSDLLFQRGYGIFDFFRTRNGEIPWLEDYTERLFNSIRLSAIEANLSEEDFLSIIRDLQKKNNLVNGAFKVIVTGGYSETLESVTGRSNILVLNIPWNRPPRETREKGVGLITCNYVRPNPEIKTLNYFNTIRLRDRMRKFGAVDVLFYRDTFSEASRANVFFVKDGSLYTPGSNILPGITRKQVLKLFSNILVTDIPSDQLYSFDEIFIVSTSRDITPVVNIEGKKIGNGKPGPVCREVQEAFHSRGWI